MMRFVKIILIFILVIPFFGCATDTEEVTQRPRVPFVPHIFLEQESIIAFYEVTNIDEYKKLIPSIFSMPERPICKVAVYDFYKMESGPPYFESLIQILVKYKRPQSGEEILAWYFLTMSVTSEEALWGRFAGYPKVQRKVAFERYVSKYVGISYDRDGKTPAFKLIFELKKAELTPDEKSFIDFVSPIPILTIMDGKVINRGIVGGGGVKHKIYECEKVAPKIWNIRFGDCSIDYPNDPNNYLHRLGMGRFISGYWLKQKARYQIQYKEE
ncbi:MAG: hypothetical protein A2170_06775 [Deltaproteobacteria bacterium RBG_13_53_10]|nr:MAG: hypothetical protein A2170_06775 [Deltaproteobacteria bacterium RBG_13_53_10]